MISYHESTIQLGCKINCNRLTLHITSSSESINLHSLGNSSGQ